MTSVQSYIKPQPRLSVGLIDYIYTPGYTGETYPSGDSPVPFIIVNGILDINPDWGFGFNITTSQIANALVYNVRQLGGDELITGLSDNFINFLNNNATYSGTNYRIYSPGTMTKIQFCANPLPIEAGTTVTDGTTENKIPSSSFYTGGVEANNYLTTWVFRNPLTIVFSKNGADNYLTLGTSRLPVD